jgi:hypothetical protein
MIRSYHYNPEYHRLGGYICPSGEARPELKGPKREIFVAGIFTEIRPVWLGYLLTRPKNPKKLRLGPYITLYLPRFLF